MKRLMAMAMTAAWGLAAPAGAQDSGIDPQAQQFMEAILVPMVEEVKGSLGRQMQMTQRLNGQIITEVDFKDASLDDVVDFLAESSKELDKDQRPINFVVTPSARQATEGRTVNLKLRNVPLGQVLRYGTEMLGIGYRLDEYAVVIVPHAPASALRQGSRAQSPAGRP